MKIPSLLFGLVLLACGVTANAHAHLQKSSPADNSTITTSPPNLVLNLSEAARLTALSIQKGEEPKQDLKPLPTTAAQQVSIPLPALTPGSYAVSWKAGATQPSGVDNQRFSTCPEKRTLAVIRKSVRH